MDSLEKYIISSFNLMVDLDSTYIYKNSRLELLKPKLYKVFVSPIRFPKLQDKRQAYIELLSKALSEWEKAINGLVKFQLTDKNYEADIIVYWAKGTLKYSGLQFQEELCGRTRQAVTIGVIGRNRVFSDSEVYHLFLHEFGHIIGLGHSPDNNCVMGTGTPWATKLSQDDIFVLNLLYSLPQGATYESYKSYIREEIAKYKNKTELKLPSENRDLNYELDLISNINKNRISNKFLNN